MMLRWHEEALREAQASAAFYRARQPGLEQRFLDALEDALAHIQRHPGLFREVEAGIRKCKLHRFPYHVVYRTAATHIEVVAVAHVRRRPGFWRHRD